MAQRLSPASTVMQLDVHDTERRIERAYESIRKNEALPDTEKQKILAFDEFLAAKQISEQRRLVYLLTLPRIQTQLQKNFRRARKQDIVKSMANLETQDLEGWTKHTYRVVTKKFLQWLTHHNQMGIRADSVKRTCAYAAGIRS